MKKAVFISTVFHISVFVILYVITNLARNNESYKIEGQESISIQAQIVYASFEPNPINHEKIQENQSKKTNNDLQSFDKSESIQNTITEKALNLETTLQVQDVTKSKIFHSEEPENNSTTNNNQNEQKHTSDIAAEEEKRKNITGEQLNELVSYLYQEINKHKKYPRNAYKMAIEGSVEVNFILYPENNIERLKIIASSGSDLLDEAALKSIKDAQPFKGISKYLQEKQEFNLVLRFEL